MYKKKLFGGVAGDCSEEFSGRPLYQSYKVDVDGVMFAGEYPGDRDEEVAKRKIAQMHSFGIRHIVDLTEEGELCPYSHLLPSDMTHYRFPIKDVSVPKDTESVRGLIQRIDELKTLGGYVYIHCWGGVGRTGTVVACYISAHKRELDANQVLAMLRGFFSMMPKSSRRKTPDSRSQVSYIKNFVQANVSCKEQCVDRVRDAIRGSLMAGAAGDALGYAVEFNSRSSILARYGERGITQFALNAEGKALISDDTQMTLFTANGLLMGITRGCMRGIGAPPEFYVQHAYMDWYYTQGGVGNDYSRRCTWLCSLPEMAHRRAPGVTCLSACDRLINGDEVSNDSKGCGGIMRVAPLALLSASVVAKYGRGIYDGDEMFKAGCYIARVTHLHPLGFLPAGMMTELLYKLVLRSTERAKADFVSLVEDTLKTLDRVYPNEYIEDKRYLANITRRAITLAQSDVADADAIRKLGEGWVAEETWAIALYCAMRHLDSVEDAIIASVNHDGDSDSTGSVCGNIMGAIYGYEHIKERNIFCPEGCKLEDTLELSEITLAMADDLYTGCIIGEYCRIDTPEKRQWEERYCNMIPSGISTSGINN